MRSRFSNHIAGPIVCFFLLLFAIIFCAFAFARAGIELEFILLVDLLPFVILAWVFYGEFRTKMVVAFLGNNYIILVTYGGAGQPKKILYQEFDGYATSLFSPFNTEYEYLYFIQDGKKVGKLSQFYHSNYDELKNEIQGKLKYLGHVEFNYWHEIRESFS